MTAARVAPFRKYRTGNLPFDRVQDSVQQTTAQLAKLALSLSPNIWQPCPATPTLGGTLTLTPAQANCSIVPLIGVLTSNLVVVLPNEVGLRIFDCSGLTPGTFTVQFMSGTATSADVHGSLSTTRQQVTVITRGSNTISLSV